MKTATVAIGGNAILRSGEPGTFVSQMTNIRRTAKVIVDLIEDGYDLVLTHGNGPQVGNMLLQNECAEDQVPPMPLDVLVSGTQGEIGYMLQQGISGELLARGLTGMTVVTVVTRVLIDPDDAALLTPTKPIGPYYPEAKARRMMEERGWKMVQDAQRGGWRRLVPSPTPKDILEKEAIRRLVFTGGKSDHIVIAAGGGGIPVVRKGDGYQGVEAVVDKDLATSVLASSIRERLLVMLTDVPHVYVDFTGPERRALHHVSLAEVREHLEQGEFPAGSMGPKVQAAVSFLERGGEEVVITSPERLREALARGAGTHIYRRVPLTQTRLTGT